MPCFYVKSFASRANKHYLRSKIVGKDGISDFARTLSEISTVDVRDVYAVLIGMGDALSKSLSNGKSVKLDGLGTFYLALNGKGEANAADLSFEKNVKAVRVRFIPELKYSSSGAATRAMVDGSKLDWVEWGAEETSTSQAAAGGSSTSGGDSGGTSSSGSDSGSGGSGIDPFGD